MAWILLVVGILHVIGIHWGLPASDGWDNDGVAPRDFLPGLAATFTPGQFYTYPPVHLLILAVLTLPITLVALVRAPSMQVADVIGEILKVPYMTSMAYVARGVALVMSLAIVFFLARIAEEIRAKQLAVEPPSDVDPDPRVRRVGWCVAAFAGVNASLTYYGKLSNLDVPYLFWATWSLLMFTRAVAREQPKLLRRAFLLAVLAIGTKDQAYAMFLLSIPIVWTMWIAGLKETRRAALRESAIAVGMAVFFFLLVDCAIVNPLGFMKRVAFLTGSASQDYVEYVGGWTGRLGILADAARWFHFQYPPVFAIAIAAGLFLAWREKRARALALLPLLVAVSFTVTFNWTARRTDARFLLPQAMMFAVYGGIAIESAVFARARQLRIAGQLASSIAFALAIWTCICADANLVLDSRYDAESWLADHVKEGDTIETYGLNVYFPRFDALRAKGAHVTRVGPEPSTSRNPIPGVKEIQAPFGEAPSRNARFIVVSTGWVWRYLIAPNPHLPSGRALPPTHHRSASDEASSQWFDHLVSNQSPFEWAHDARYDDHIFPIVDIHGTSGRAIWIFERRK